MPIYLNHSMNFQCTLITLFFIGIFTQSGYADSNHHQNIASHSETVPAVIKFDNETQKTVGLQTTPVKLINYHPEFMAYGSILSVKPLLLIQQQYLTTQVQLHNAKIKRAISQKSLTRLQNLYRNNAVSTRKLQNQHVLWQTDQSQLETLSLKRQAILSTSQLQWGKQLTQWFTESQSPQADKLISGQTKLLQITLPAGRKLPEGVRIIEFSIDGQRKNALSAQLIAIAPQVDNLSQGIRYFFLSSTPNIPVGITVTAWIHDLPTTLSGMIIPQSALLWHQGQTFIYIKINHNQFKHKPVNYHTETADGYFITSDIKVGERVVSQGAQMLLSYEYRSQIPSEDHDD